MALISSIGTRQREAVEVPVAHRRRATIPHHGEVGRRAPHVEGDQVRDAERLPLRAGPPRLRPPDPREASRPGSRAPRARWRSRRRCACSAAAPRFRPPPERSPGTSVYCLHRRAHVGRGRGGVGPREFLDLGVDLARAVHRTIRETAARTRWRAASRAPDWPRRRAGTPRALRGRAPRPRRAPGSYSRLVERRHHLAECVDALGDLDHPGARHQRLGLRRPEIVGVGPPLAAEREHVAEARRGQQDDPAPGPGEPRVGGDGEAVQQEVEVGRGRTGSPRDPGDALDHRPRRPRRRRHLVDERPAAGGRRSGRGR